MEKKLNDTQEYILSVLNSVIKATNEMNVKCYMQGGTMLGAIRHGGFIPWDDDVDLGIMRNEYEIFLKNVKKYLPGNLELRTYWDESDHHYYFARIVDACNYGAFLQTKALSEFINEQCEREVYIVDYKNKSIINDYSVRNVFNFNQGLKTIILKLMRLPDILKRNSIFNMYQKDTFKLVKVNDISEYKISKVVVGSDQVWNLELTGGDLNYFLPFVEPECRISYAASVGHVGDNIDKKIFEEKLSLFDSISVREKELADMINSLNINKKAVICMDPVFLKSKLAWKEYIADTDININFPYILVFIMGVSKQADYIVRRALEVGKKNNCQVILIGDQERWYKYRQVKHFGVATPREFIKLIDSAKCVFTNSFHATAFSIILNSSFYTEMNISNNGRIESLLNLAGLESRKMYDGKLNSLYTTKINWDIVTKKLQPEIEKSKKFLQVNL